VKKADVLREFASLAPGISPAKSLAELPSLQIRILEVAKELWPDGKTPPRVKERNEAIQAKFKKPAPNERTIRRALKGWP